MIRLACLLVAVAASAMACASPGPAYSPDLVALDGVEKKRSPRFDVSVFGGSEDLDEIEFDPDDDVSPFGQSADLELERDRVGVRAAFGPETVRGHVQVFAEELDGEFFGPVFGEYDALGVGIGVLGYARLNDPDDAVGFLIPYTARLSFTLGAEDDVTVMGVTADSALAYFELHGDVGFGLEWMGLRPMVGVQVSTLAGALVFDEDLGADGDDDEIDLTGTNYAPFAELYYKHPEFPLYARFRAGGGDYDGTELAVGAAW